MADRLRNEGKFDEAIEACLHELKAHPTYISARMVLARAYLERGDRLKAEEQFCCVLELEPDNVRACVHLAQICEAQGRIGDAIKYYEAAREWVPLDRESNAGLIRLHGSGSSSELAHSEAKGEELFDRSPEASASESLQGGEEPFATETMADLCASQGLLDRAASIYRQLLGKEPLRVGIRAKLEALEEGRMASGTFQPGEVGQGSIPTPSPVSWPSSPMAPLPEINVIQEEALSAGTATTGGNSPEQRLLVVLERWLEGIRRYRKMESAAGR